MLDDLLASFTLLTRLPFWRLRQIPAECFSRAVDYWPLVGWLTGGVTAGVLWLASAFFPVPAAVVMAFAARVLLTGAFHEDGLGDFFDGFGGGRTREQTLEIMKDSRTGSYGVLGLVFYYASLFSLVAGLPVDTALVAVLVGDPLAKWIASQIVNLLPYARAAEQSKVGAVYRRMTPGVWAISAAAGVLPALLWLPSELWGAVAAPAAVMAGLVWAMRRRIGGYTGDCCGAAFLLCELAFYAGIWVVRL